MTIQTYLMMDTEELVQHLMITLDVDTCGKDFIFVKGDKGTPFTIVAHVDTLPRKRVELIQRGNIITNRHGLLGADDRAGVYAALQIYKQAAIKPHLLFTDKEESGGLGAKEVVKYLHKPEGTRLLIELDRQSCNEYVTYQPQKEQVHNYIKKFGFVEGWGSYSDIADIAPAWQCASVNLSVGYYDQHSKDERLHIDETQLTINRVLQMIQDPITKDYPPTPPRFYNKKGSLSTCDFCFKETVHLFKVEGHRLCSDCKNWLAMAYNEYTEANKWEIVQD